MIRSILFVIASLFLLTNSFAQKGHDYVIKDNDTTFYANVASEIIAPKNFTTQPFHIKLTCTDNSGEETTINDAHKEGFSGFSAAGMVYDWMDVKISKENNLFFWKKINGELTLYSKNDDDTPGTYEMRSVTWNQVIKTKDGKLIVIGMKDSDKEVKTKLAGIISSCPMITKLLGEDISYKKLEFIVAVYNNYCKPGPKATQDFVLSSKSKDTLYVNLLQFSPSSIGTTSIVYVDAAGKVVELKSSDCDNVISFRQNGNVYDLLPLKEGKQAYHRHFWKKLDGKIDYYYYMTYQDGMSFALIREKIRMPDGNIYDLDKQSMKTYIKPLVDKCAAFKAAYKGDYSPGTDEAVKLILMYNLLCK